ncbi:lasso RiPP family leader peptide-containing protein [Actinomadura sp. 21ATH]
MQETVYEPPMLAAAGAFADVTLGDADWGIDRKNECAFYQCDGSDN